MCTYFSDHKAHLTCSLPAYQYIVLWNQPKIKQFSCVWATA